MACELVLSDGDRVVGYLIEDAAGGLRVCLPLADRDRCTVVLDDPPAGLRAAVPPRSVPCDWCATLMPDPHRAGGRWCCEQCRVDARTQRRSDRRERLATVIEGTSHHA